MKRTWGKWKVLSAYTQDKTKGIPIVKTKELYVNSGCSLSMQRHEDRSELWFVAEGTATVSTLDEGRTFKRLLGVYNKFDFVIIPCYSWHQLENKGDKPLTVIEIQYGSNCMEEDIERFDCYATYNRGDGS
jgi:mannose-1-phosphate guanylyltransferase/mannose-6-phosphate isomerase|tara:strand:+ start:40 stop:432 length:393 start_codon:yes stop_codon:yes gene_type:complete